MSDFWEPWMVDYRRNSRVWKWAAKKWRGEVIGWRRAFNYAEMELIPLKQQFDDWAEQNREYHATATRRLELLRRMTQLMEDNLEWRAHDIYEEFSDELAKELKDE